MKHRLLILAILFLFLPQTQTSKSHAFSIGNLTVNVAEVSPELQPMVNIFNGAMGIIGVKNLTNGVVNYAKQMPDKVKGLIQRNESIKQALFDAYLEWRVAVANLDNLDDAEKQLIAKQEQVWRALGVTDEIDNAVGSYTTTIKWGQIPIEARPFGKGYWGKRIVQSDTRVNGYELKINPNNESFYLPHPEGGFVQFENITDKFILQDGKLVMDKSSIYHVLDKPEFLVKSSVLDPAIRQLESAKAAGYKIEWLVSDEKAVQQLRQFFKEKNMDITVNLLPE